MKKNTYLQDIRDTLGEENSSENLLSIAKKIKSSQKKAFPSSEFKQQLADKLSNIYILNIESEEKSRFTFLQMFGAFASFIFIAGSIFSFHHMRELSEIKLPESMDTLSIPSKSMEMKGVQGGSAETMIVEDDMSREDESQVIQESMSESSQDSDIAPRMMQIQETPQQIRETQEPEVNNVEQRNMRNSMNVGGNEDIMNSSIQSDEAPQSESQINTFSSLYFQEERTDLDSQDENTVDFAGLCESYGGEYSFETQTCTLTYGTICEEYDENTIFDCYQRDNTDSR